MLEAVVGVLNAITPIFVAGITAVGGVLVAKVNKVQKDARATNEKVTQVQQDIVTNHGSKNLGDAVDRLTEKVGVISDNQDELIQTVRGMQARDEAVEARVQALEHSKTRVYRHVGLSPTTGPVQVKTHSFKKKRRK